MRPDILPWRLATAGAALLAGLAAAPAPAAEAAMAPQAGAAGDWPVRGQATMRYFGLAIYEATLSSPAAVSPETWATQPLALSLVYQRKLSGRAIAERSLQEMKRGGAVDEAQAAGWLAFMKTAFPDVQPGDRLVGHWWPAEGRVSFLAQGGATHERIDAEFGRRFFGIWLAPHTSEPALRVRLLGLP
ncbi:Chalcone_isomerase domain-containing protein [Rubrivivax sp. A210]|uniref:chalcone isomerase family protein n=1 Tax=Rubrivivax sp. A210 TaxID=2772301 RepID=UPI001918439D|nr:chalcone isomerase family protein [Rubrivivax sp. A210]CAD5367025.1 Chalcone_isomerase domain-containing protein [Rubrivivax sp. A210]